MSKKSSSWETKDGTLKFSIIDGQLEVEDQDEGDVIVLATNYDELVEAQDILTKAIAVMALLPRKPATEAAEDDVDEDELDESDLDETEESEEDESDD